MDAIYKDNKQLFAEIFYATVGTILLGFAIGLFFNPNNIVTGGVTGVGIIIEEVSTKAFGFGIPVWISNLLINAPLLLIAMKTKGAKFIVRTIYCTILLSIVLFVIELFPPILIEDKILISLCGSVLSGTGLGFVFRGLASTGGTDLLSVIINHKYKHISVTKLIFYLDSSIVILGFFIFGFERTVYAVISIFVSSKLMEYVLEGVHFSKAAFIISSKPVEIAKEIMDVIQRGATGLNGHGMFTNKEKTVILTVVSVKEIAILKDLVRNIDENSFVIVADVREVLGEGFRSFG